MSDRETLTPGELAYVNETISNVADWERSRYVTAHAPEPARLESVDGRGDPDQHYRLYRLCPCDECKSGMIFVADGRRVRCPKCRGEGRTLQLVATCATPSDLGVALVTLAGEGEFDECPIGILEDGGSWLVKPWLPSPRNVSDAGRVLAKSKGDEQ